MNVFTAELGEGLTLVLVTGLPFEPGLVAGAVTAGAGATPLADFQFHRLHAQR